MESATAAQGASGKGPIHVMAYHSDGVSEQYCESARDAAALVGRQPVTWINIHGPVAYDALSDWGECFHLHKLALEDVASGNQRAKAEPYPEHLFIVLRMIRPGHAGKTEQLSLFLGANYVLTIQEAPGDVFDGVRTRIRKGGGRIRGAGSDYLAYALLDAVVDSYFPVLEHSGEDLENLEGEILSRPGPHCIRHLHRSKRGLLALRRAVWPQRELFNSLLRDPNPLVTGETRIFLRDCYDHTVEIMDLVETLRELSSDLVDLYMSTVSNRLNEVMKVLTIIATIFMPLSFIASVFGMNFQTDASPWNMPELRWYWGYFYALGIMALVALVFLWFFHRRGWLRPMDRLDGQRRLPGTRRPPAKK